MAAAKAADVLVSQKERRVDELYNETELNTESEIVPALKGSDCMQVPADEMDKRIQKNTVPPKTVKRSLSQKVHKKVESGTCNVCSAPCSSCMHLSQMGSEKNEFSDETDSVAVATQYSINEDKTSDSLQHTHSEASNLLCVNSSHDSYSENIDSKATTSPSDASEGVGIQRTFSNKYDGFKGIEGPDDSSSCASGANDANAAFSYCNKALDSQNSFRSSVSVCSLGSGKVPSSQKVDLSELPSIKEEDVGSGSLKTQSPGPHSQSDKSVVAGSFDMSTKIHLKSEADIDGEPLDKAGKSLNEDDHDESNKLVESPGKVESPLQAASGDESCESVAIEHDVKVCDICGDAGREDLLAICSKCADGAEHTYCMREMLQKIPEGDWLCEECKLAEEAQSRKQGLDSVAKKANKLSSFTQSLGKRHAEHLEGSPTSKRQAVVPNMGSPKSLSPSKVSVLSRDGSFKNLDKGRVRPSLQLPLGNHSGSEMLETVSPPTSGPRLQSPKSTFLKSKSFNAFNSKPEPKVKLVDEVAVQKQKFARKHASLDRKEETSRVMGKSMSFKSTNSGQLSTRESKFKMPSSKYPHVQDPKGLKQVTERISLERKNLSKLDRSSSTVSAPKVDHKLTPRTDAISHSSASNNREIKALRPDGKPSTLSRSTSNLARKGVENAVTSACAVTSTNVCISSEHKLNQVSLKEEPSSSSSSTAGRQPSNINGIISEGLSLDSTNQSERMGHTAEYCSVSQASGADLSAPRNFRQDINKGNKLKAAIEAAIRLRPGICEKTSQDPSSVSLRAKNMISVEGINESQTSLRNQASIGSMNVLNSHSTDALSVVSSVGNAPPLVAEAAVSKISAIPEHEYIWQGAFQVHKMGKPPDFCVGIQAHLSTFASPKVLEVVNTFPLEVPLHEVPRLSTWPTQFHNGGPKEDNIALYLFAKDLESYEKYYKVLLDTMVSNDLALKGNLEGVEFLIFPSTQLPQSCQRWNTLLFLWGVFKGRREICSNSSKSVSIPDASIVRFERERSTDISQPADNESATCDSSCNVVVTSAVENTCISTERVGDNKVSSFEKTYLGIKANLEQDGKIDIKYSSRIATSSIKVEHPDMNFTSPLEDNKVPDCRLETECKPSLQATETNIPSFKVKNEEMHVQEDYPSLKNRPNRKQKAAVGKFDGESIKIRESRDDGYVDLNTYSKSDIDCWQSNHLKRPYLDLTKPVLEMSTDTSESMPWSEVRRVSIDGGSDNKRLKTGFSGIFQFNSVRDEVTFSDGASSDRRGLGSGFSFEEKRRDIMCEEKVIPEDMGRSERFLFPVGSHRGREFPMVWKELPLKDKGRVVDASPNLELALGAEMRPPNKGMLPFFVGTTDKSDNLDKETGKEEADDISASLSLSLSYPSPETERNAKSVPKTEQLLPESNHVNTSLLLFGRFPDK